MVCLKFKKNLELLNWNENNWLKVLIKMRTGKKEILLVERLIGTEKRKQKYI